MLERLGYTVLAAGTPGEAIRLAREHAGAIRPADDRRGHARDERPRPGRERLLSLHPDLKRLFMSGYTANVIAHHGVLDEGVHFIQKPFTTKDLAAKVREDWPAGTGPRSPDRRGRRWRVRRRDRTRREAGAVDSYRSNPGLIRETRVWLSSSIGRPMLLSTSIPISPLP